MTEKHTRDAYFEVLNSGMEAFDSGNVPGMIDVVFRMHMHLSKMQITHPEADAWVFSNFAEICSDVLGAIYAQDPNAEKTMGKKVRKISKWAEEFNKKALDIFPLCLYAQKNETTWAANLLSMHGMSFGEILKTARSQADSYNRSYSFTYNLTASGSAKRKYKNALKKFVSMFTEYFSTLRVIDDMLEYSQFLILLADFSEETGQGKPKEILSAILAVETKNLTFYEATEEEEREKMVEELLKLFETVEARIAAL